MSSPVTVRFTKNFDQNLETIEAFLEAHQASREFEALLTELSERIIPNLERFPDIGRDFFAHTTQSNEAMASAAFLSERVGGQARIREIIIGDYVILYAVRLTNLYLLAIKHHRQLAFDLRAHWR